MLRCIVPHCSAWGEDTPCPSPPGGISSLQAVRTGGFGEVEYC